MDLSSLITFDGIANGDASDNSFEFFAPDHALIPGLQETYTLLLTASSTGITSSPASFLLTVFDPCQFATITFTPTVFTDYTYILWDAAHPDLVWTDATAA